MRTTSILALTLIVGLASCGGDDDSAADDAATADAATAGDDESGDSGGDAGEAATNGEVIDPQPPGQALVSVDGQEYILTEPGALDCTLADDSITFSFRIGDNEVTLGAGANQSDGQWFGGVDLRVADPAAEPGPIAYFTELPANSAGMAVDGDSFSYSGPMLKQPPNDGSNPPPIDVGDGLVTVTCP